MNDGPANPFDRPVYWLVCFHTGARTWWVRAIPGRYKHVSALGLCPRSRMWIAVDPALDGTRVWAWRDGAPGVNEEMGAWMGDALVVGMKPLEGARPRAFVGGWCVPSVARLLGLRTGALRPDALLRDCLRHGGRVLADELQDAEAAA